MRIAELEHRVYDLTESPDQLAKDLLQDVDLLMTIPYQDNLEMALSMIETYKKSFPKNDYNSELDQKKQEITEILNLNRNSRAVSSTNIYREEPPQNSSEDLKVEFSVSVSERSSGFIDVKLSIQNKSDVAITNVWLKATLKDTKNQNYGITQDFFFNRIDPYEYKSEALGWEYVKLNKIEGIVLKEIRYSKNRKTQFLKESECVVGQGNVKIFLEF
jgi:hypothetical protein